MKKREAEIIESLIRLLSGAIKNMALYPPGHPAIAQPLNNAKVILDALLLGRERLTLGIMEDILVYEDSPLEEASSTFKDLVERLREREVGLVVFQRGLSLDDLRKFVETLTTDPRLLQEKGGAPMELLGKGVSRIILAKPVLKGAEYDGVREIYQDALEVTKKAIEEARLGKIPESREAKRVVQGMVDAILKDKYALLGLTMIKSYDEYLFNHSVNVSILSLALGEKLGLPEAALNELGLGALLHDVGKIFWPPEITRKPRQLNEEEWGIVRNHPVDGAGVLERMEGVGPLAVAVVLEHHVGYDLTGYPTLEPEKKPHPYSMVITIADGYDALTTLRSYQKAFDPKAAVHRMLELSGKVFDPELLDSFIQMLGIYPVGALVRLNTNELAIVTKPNPHDSSHPWARLIYDGEGKKLEGLMEVDLSERDGDGRYKRFIVATIDPILKNIRVSDYLG
ncbi:MAG: HD domain-containing protein [candidate division NC10 bacterium]|nr:HD domain-containing protein [candidate division NC10 bacterium]